MKISEMVELLSDMDPDLEVIIDGGGLSEYEIEDVGQDADGDEQFAVIVIRRTN
jgi:hypothetical protein